MALTKDLQYAKFCAYGFLKNQRFFEPFIVLFFLEKGLTYFQIGLLVTVREVIQNLLEVPTGVVSDSIGRRRTLVGAFALYIAAFLILSFSGSYWLFFAAMVFYAAGDAFRSGTHKAMIYEYLRLNGWQDQKVDYYGHTRSWSQMGSAVSSLLAVGIVFVSGNYSAIILAAVVPYLLDLMLMLTYPKALDGRADVSSAGAVRRQFVEVFRLTVGSLRVRRTRRALANSVLYSGPFKVMKDYYQPILAALAGGLALRLNTNLSTARITAILIGVMYFLLYLGTSWASRNARHFSEKHCNLQGFLNRSLVGGLLLFVLAGLCFLSDWHWLTVLPFTAIYMMENLRRPVGVAYISENFPPDILVTVLSIESQLRSLLAAVLAPVTGLLADSIGIAPALVILGGVLLLLCPFAKLDEEGGAEILKC